MLQCLKSRLQAFIKWFRWPNPVLGFLPGHRSPDHDFREPRLGTHLSIIWRFWAWTDLVTNVWFITGISDTFISRHWLLFWEQAQKEVRGELISHSSRAVAKKSGKGSRFTLAWGRLHCNFYYIVARKLAEKSRLLLFWAFSVEPGPFTEQTANKARK